jgi:hypothetical protein
MSDTKKQNEIKVLAKYLRRQISDIQDMKLVVKELFKGEAELSMDSDHQIVIYTGHSFEGTNERIYSTSCIEFLNS